MKTAREYNDLLLARGRREAQKVRLRGGSELAMARALLDGAFTPRWQSIDMKARVVGMLALGPVASGAKWKFAPLAQSLYGRPVSVELAVRLLEYEQRRENALIARSVRCWGKNNRGVWQSMVLREALLMLRFARRWKRFEEFAQWMKESEGEGE